MPVATVVIPTHNRRQGLAELLGDLARQEGLAGPIEVIAVDSPAGEDIDDVVAAARAQGLDARRLLTDNNRATKRNAGARAAAADVLLFADDDMRVPPGWVAAHLAEQARRRDAWVSGAVAFPAEWTRASNYYRYKNTRHANPATRAADGPLEPHRVVTMNMSIPRALFERAGALDPGFARYGGEDVEFGFRVRRSGGALWYAAAPAAEHREVRLDVVGFCRKLYVAAYAGAARVLDSAPESADVATFRWTEPGRQRGVVDHAVHAGLRVLARPRLVAGLARLLRRVDANPHCYAPAAFRALTLLVTQVAVDDRESGLPERSARLFPADVG